MPAWALKAGASVLTLLAALGSAAYVGAHLKNAAAPLHPTVAASGHQLAFFSIGGGGSEPTAPVAGSLHISASVQVAGPEAALTYTSVS